MNGVCCVSKMLKGQRQTLNSEPTRTWLGPAWLTSIADSSVSQTAACLPASAGRTEPSPEATGGEDSM